MAFFWIVALNSAKILNNLGRLLFSQKVMRVLAGVAQLVELQPSKLNVASSSLVSRSMFRIFDLH